MRNRAFVILLIAILLNSMPFLINPSTSANCQQRNKAEGRLLTIEELPTKSKRYALIIGVDKYEDQKITTLKGATNDAKTLAQALIDYASFPKDQVVVLTNDQSADLQPRRNNILEKLSNLSATAKRDNGLLLISFAGHGIERKGQPYLLSTDARLGNENDLDLLEETAVNVNRMKSRLKGLDQVILILDACRTDPESGRGEAENKLTDSFARNFGLDTKNKEVKAFATLFATSPGQVSYEYKDKAQGYFTYALVEALKGQADNLANEKGEITLGKLVGYLQERVPKLVSLNLGKQQKPQLIVEGYKPEQLVISVTVNIGNNVANNSIVPPVAGPNASAVELEFWNSIKESNDPEDFKAYLQQYQNGSFVALAKNKLNRLTISISATSSATSPTSAGEPEPVASLTGKFVRIPAGEFMMGTDRIIELNISFGMFNDFERPLHRVRLTREFEMGRYEVTQAQWEAVMESNPSKYKGANLPVENVSWHEVQEFINKLNSKSTKYIYRLPTEAEWEYACRAGTTGDYAGNLDSMAWYGNNSGNRTIDALEIFNNDQSNYGKRIIENGCRTHPVGQKQPNSWGLYDMHGNVGEWCQDWYDQNYYKQSPVNDPQGPNSGPCHLERGGSSFGNAQFCRSAYRYGVGYIDRSDDLGFRLARNLR